MSDPRTTARRTRATLLAMALAFLAGGPGVLASAQEDGEPSAAELMDVLMWGHHPVDTSFSLTDHDGKLRTHQDFRGKLLIVYFGYTFCPDICPTDLQAIAEAIDRLGPKGDRVQALFVTLDPERDTAAHLAGYVPLFHAKLIGLTGAPEEIKRAARGYKVYFARTPGGRMSGYMLDHSAFIYFVDADGRYVGFLPPGTSPDRLVEAVSPHLVDAPR
jgi:cytochrome oxidase Cu insertion factor (SCO1/SenC/PrrC family)